MNNWDKLADNARVWLYAANRPLTDAEVSSVNTILDRFCDEWAAHGAKLDCGFQVLYHQIIVLAVDEASAAASGCSIDTSVQVFREIDAQLDIDLFNRLRSYAVDGNRLRTMQPHEVKSAVADKQLQPQSEFIDMLVTTKADVMNQLRKPMSQTWLSKYLG